MARISFNQSSSPNIKDMNGYGYAGKMCKRSLENLGHEVAWRDPTADIEMNFIQPEKWHWSGPYRIGYVPWESTEFPEGWVDMFNNDCDELWTPSPVVAQWMVDAGVKKDVKIYQHGVEPVWAPRKRSLNDRYAVFHHGAEGLRKGADIALQTMLGSIWEEYVKIVFKSTVESFAIRGSHRLEIVPGRLPLNELVSLYQKMNLMLYPSWGEGFGLVPLQAMATGMPVLITRGWAPYEYLLEDYQLIDSELSLPPAEPIEWRKVHPGKMFKPNVDDAMDKLKYQFENRHELTVKAFDLAPKVHDDYNWDALTEKAFEHLFGK